MRYRTHGPMPNLVALAPLAAAMLAGCQGPRPAPPAPPQARATAHAHDSAPMKLTGAAEAEADIANGRLRLKRIGWPSPWQQTHAELLQKRFGVTLDHVAGDYVTAEVISRTTEYNRRMAVEIASRFGEGALEQVEKEAKQRWRAALP